MPAYSTTTPARAIYPGNEIALVNNGATDTGITKTAQVAFAPMPGYANTLALVNTTTQAATVQVAGSDVDANYQALKDADTGTAITAAAGGSVQFTCIGPWIRCLMAAAPTSGSLVLSR
jgi:hypothetical protein